MFSHFDMNTGGTADTAGNMVYTYNMWGSLGNLYRVAIFKWHGTWYDGWQNYIYSDFVGGVGTFQFGDYPIDVNQGKYPPIIGKYIPPV